MPIPPPLHHPSFDASSIPLPTSRPPPMRTPTRAGAGGTSGTLRRAKTLTRPERGVAPAPLIKPPEIQSVAGLQSRMTTPSSWDPWVIFSHLVTFWAPPFLLSSIGGLKDRPTRQAWREKIALCFIALVLGGVVGFATVGLDRALCPESSGSRPAEFSRLGSTTGTVGIGGQEFNISASQPQGGVNFYEIAAKLPGVDVTGFFSRKATDFPACRNLKFKIATDAPCATATNCPLGTISDATFRTLAITKTNHYVGYDWEQVAAFKNFMVLDGTVLNLDPYMLANPKPIANDPVDAAIRTILLHQDSSSGKDGTRLFYNRDSLKSAAPCLLQRYVAGNIDKVTPGCFISQLFLYASLVVILGVVMARFAMACVFNWFMSSRLVAPPKNLSRTVISPAVLPEGANLAVDNRNGTAPWAKAGAKKLNKGPGGKPRSSSPTPSSSTTLTYGQNQGPLMSMQTIGAELFCVCLVTCYSEGEDSIRTTLDSISSTTYSDARKLLFVVADGMITGEGEKRSTPDICVSLLESDPRFGNPIPMSYLAVASGAKKENRAMVYAGHYTVSGRRTPTVVVVKCGTEAEAAKDKKPGNRGKRDSQLILMNFFSRVTYNDRMTPLDFDLFRKVQVLMGVTPDFFEVCLMVDADTKVHPDSLTQLVNSMHHDNLIMGVCGETRIANKRQSWVTAIQVYEYFISHHLAKAFESVFGGVTCLPGCFSMYRLKARKSGEDDWVPLITKPEIVREYSQSEVHTLHQKNLLLLGEDRFLTTILLRTFPNRKMMFCPQARCRTVVPDTFAMLLSQRRRWINSTIHNLMELVRVRNLCGTFCFSMQFVVFMDLLGTTVLPIAITLTYALIVNMALNPPDTFEKAIPLMLLVAVIGLPAILILITTRKVVYVFWMLIYLVALPVWNFILPVYAFWHFDDFSWGETRRVEGEGASKAHVDTGGSFDEATIPMRRWEDWERSRLRKIKRMEKRRRDLERSFPHAFGHDPRQSLRPWNDDSTFDGGSDTISIVSSNDDDQWGTQIGAYNENGAQYPPPPSGLIPVEAFGSSTTLDHTQLEAMLEQGWDDKPPVPPVPSAFSSTTALLPATTSRYQLNDAPSSPRGYTPVARTPSPTPTPTRSRSTAIGTEEHTHARQRSGTYGNRGSDEGWGPLGPLDPAGPTRNPNPSRRL